MTPLGISNIFVPPLFAKSNCTDCTTFNDFRAQIDLFGANRPTPSDLLFDSFTFISNRIPPVDDLRGPLSAFRVNDAGRFVTERFGISHIPIIDEVGASRLTSRQTDDIDNLQIRLQTLQQLDGEMQPILKNMSDSNRNLIIEKGQAVKDEAAQTLDQLIAVEDACAKILKDKKEDTLEQIKVFQERKEGLKGYGQSGNKPSRFSQEG